MAVSFHCGDTSIARALYRKGLLESDSRVRAGKRRAILTPAGEAEAARRIREEIAEAEALMRAASERGPSAHRRALAEYANRGRT